MATINASAIPAKVAITNNSEKGITLPLPGNNMQYTIEAGDTVAYCCQSSAEYLALYGACKAIEGLEFAEIEEEEETNNG